MELVIYIDGGSRGNPGPAAAGVVIRDAEGKPLHEGGYFIGSATNNVAEYNGLLRGLARAQKFSPSNVVIHSDSELLVRQITGEYRVKSPVLQQLYEQAQLQFLRFPRWSIRHVRREQNARADELANMAMDRRRDVIVFDIDLPDAAARTEPAPKASAPAAITETASGVSESADATNAARRIRIGLAAPPRVETCPAGEWCRADFSVDSCLPQAICVYAAHALLPTVLALQATDAADLSSFPTMTVRCGRAGCKASFRVSPEPSGNGAAR